MFYSCTHMATLGDKGLTTKDLQLNRTQLRLTRACYVKLQNHQQMIQTALTACCRLEARSSYYTWPTLTACCIPLHIIVIDKNPRRPPTYIGRWHTQVLLVTGVSYNVATAGNLQQSDKLSNNTAAWDNRSLVKLSPWRRKLTTWS